MSNREEVARFETANFAIVTYFVPEYGFQYDGDDEDGETQRRLNDGIWTAFGTIVEVQHKATGAVVGQDSLWGSVYADPREFLAGHRSADPFNRNCTIMRAARGDNVQICHYYPDMISIAVAEARETLRTLQYHKVR